MARGRRPRSAAGIGWDRPLRWLAMPDEPLDAADAAAPTPIEVPNDTSLMEKIVNLSKRRGFVFPSAEIYGGFRSTYDYGPIGVLLLRNVKDAWWRSMVQMRDDVVGLDAAILSPPAIWEASGHLKNFTDPLVDCRSCHERFRQDQLDDLTTCPNCGAKDTFTEARQFNLMFKTHAGPVEHEARGGLPAARDGAGHVRQLRQRAADQPQEAAVRHRPDRQVVPQRDHARQLRVPHPGVRADGARVLRAARRGRPVVRVLGRGPRTSGTSTSASPTDEAPPPAPRRRRAEPLLLGHLRRGVPLPVGLGRARGHRQPGRLRPHPARHPLGREARLLRPGHQHALHART